MPCGATKDFKARKKDSTGLSGKKVKRAHSVLSSQTGFGEEFEQIKEPHFQNGCEYAAEEL